MRGGPDDAHIEGDQDALIPVDAGLPHLDSQVVGLSQKSVRRCIG